jgi:hypothetical protein
MRIAITGASGFIGSRLAEEFRAQGHTVSAVRLRENPALSPSDAVIHLAGENLAQRWSLAAKREIRASRVDGTRRLVNAIAQSAERPSVLVSASAIGIYGNCGDELLTERSAPASGFLGELCQAWEAAADEAAPLGVRVVKLRIGLVLGPHGGALARMIPAFKLGAGARLGSGKQWVSWIHIADLAGLVRFAIENPALAGAVNAVAPGPVQNTEFTRELARALRRPAFAAIPEIALKLLFGEMSTVLLDSVRVTPEAALAAGFRFRYPNLAPALRDALALI